MSRRPMTRSFSGNGRTSSFSEEESSSSNGRSESRTTYLSNVRPENSYSRYSQQRPTRSTLCSVMAQLTEDIQPSFETTLKSKAVSENCNVKFTCVVSGYPAPELKWYKDDMEMDRYCGLPKYEIRRNGKTHTLQIYNCTLDDAAIYQVSASNSKGIVSCSGVLEVGTMNEYKIHQRFFEKLKQKADKKKKEMDGHTVKEDKENIQREKPPSSPERPPRKRHIPPTPPVVKKPEEPLGAAAEPNGEPNVTPMNRGPEKEKPPPVETLAKKKIRISNGADVGVNSSSNSNSSSSRSHMTGNRGENCYDGGISLAQFLAETLQSQTAEEKQNSSRVEKSKEMNTTTVNDSMGNERMQSVREEQENTLQEEREREKRRQEERVESEKEKERSLEMLHTTAHSKHGSEVKHHSKAHKDHDHHSKAHKDHDHHNIQASISSMLHTVKDFFFGKTKKDFHDGESRETEFDHDSSEPPYHDTPPSFRLHQESNPDAYKPLTEDTIPMETDKPKGSSESVDSEQQSSSLVTREHKHEDSVQHIALPPAHNLPPESAEESPGQSVKLADDAVESMEVSVGTGSTTPGEDISLSGPQVLTEMEDKDSQVISLVKEVPINHQEPDTLVVPSQHNHQAAKDESSPREATTVCLLTKAPCEEVCTPTSTPTPTPTSTPSSLEDSWTPPNSVIVVSDRNSRGQVPAETVHKEQLSIDKLGEGGKPDTEGGRSSNELCVEEKAEVKSSELPFSDINRSEITDLAASSSEERIELCESKTPDQVLSDLPTVAAHGAEEDYVKEIQEMNVGFPPTAAPESLEKADLKTQHERTPSIEEESAQDHNAMQSSSSGFRGTEERSDLQEALNSAFEKDLEVKAVLESERAEAKNEQPQSKVVAERRTEELDESEKVSVTRNEENNANVLEEHSKTAHEDGGERQLGWPPTNIPEIQISTIEETSDINPVVQEVNQNEHFVIPKIEIKEPEFKECALLQSAVALNEPEPEPAVLQKHDATHVSEIIIQDQSMAESPGLLPTQRGMQNDYSLSPSGKMKEVAQLDDETKVFEQTQPTKSLAENYASIPLINVSFTDDKENDAIVNAHVSHALQPSETPVLPLFVVPPISVTCHESDPEPRLPTLSEQTETETSAAAQRGTRHNADNNTTEKTLSGKQNFEDETEKSTKESSPSLPYEALIPKVSINVPSLNKTTEDNTVPDIMKVKPLKEAKIENSVSVEDLQRNRPSVERLSSKPPAHPSLSPASLRKFMSRSAPDSDSEAVTASPVITVGDRQSEKVDEDLSGGSTPTSSLSCESSPRLKRRDSLSLIRSATPEELASGARRKIFILKPKEDGEGAAVLDTQGKKETPYMSPSQARRAALLQAPTGQNTPPMERRSPLLSRRKATLEVPKVVEEAPKEEPVTKREEKPAEKKPDPLKAPQVIRKIRGEPFPDALGHLKLWCQFFNVLSDSTIKWYRDEEEILEVKRSGGDESQVALAIVLATSQDCGVYGCTITNEYGTDTTDFLLSVDILSEILLRDDLEVGEEIEMTPLLFPKGLADSGSWADKYFGRIMTETVHIGEGCAHKATQVKVIYGLDPVFDSGSSCIIKVQSPIAYGTKQESNLAERNQEITKQECKVQNMIREYCKIFAAEARVLENFGCTLEIIPLYLMYRPANSVPYATVEAAIDGVFLKYCMMDPKGRLITRTTSEVEQKCSTFQHWIHQWTHGNLLVTRLEGVESKITNVKVVTKSKGYQGLTECGSPEVFEQFLTQHQCNYYCGLLGLRPLKSMDSLQQPTKIKGSRSPLLNRKVGSSPQLQRKGHSPQMPRKANPSPKVTRKIQETEDNKSDGKPKTAETVGALEMR